MKWTLIITSTLFLTVACSTINPKEARRGETQATAPDNSPSPLSQQQALAIARQAVASREQWPIEIDLKNQNICHTVSYVCYRINKGRWKVVAHKALSEVGPHACGDVAFDSESPGQAVIIISKDGSVIGYFRKGIGEWAE